MLETIILFEKGSHRCYLCALEEMEQKQLELFMRVDYAKEEEKRYFIQIIHPQGTEEAL